MHCEVLGFWWYRGGRTRGWEEAIVFLCRGGLKDKKRGKECERDGDLVSLRQVSLL